MSGQRPPANRMTLQQFKARRVGATKGHALLKKKRDALKTRFQAMLREIVDAKKAVAVSMQDCAVSHARACYAAGDVDTAIISRARQPSITTTLGADNVAGVFLPVFTMDHDETLDYGVDSLGISSGGQEIQNYRKQNVTTLKVLVKMASLQTSFKTLDEEIKMTGRRVNALEYVIIPKVDDVIAYIKQEMDEEAREEFTRIKKVVQKKREALEREKKNEAKRTGGQQETFLQQVASALEEATDGNVVFG